MECMLTLLLLCPFVYLTTGASEGNVCPRPELPANAQVDGLQRFFNPGEELALSCQQGYSTVFGPRQIYCTASGEWTKTKLKCRLKECPPPRPLSHGELYYEDTVYQSIVRYTCDVGYVLHGANTSVCQANGTWSSSLAECRRVSCSLAPIPQFGMAIYDTRVSGNSTYYGDSVTYKCLPPYAIFGNARAQCTASGEWTGMPECRVVTCNPPENIPEGYMSSNYQRDYDYMETVMYGCTGDYMLEGSAQVVCQHDGNWSEKPSCKAPCSVNIQRGRILYKGKKLWIADLKPNKVLHKDLVSVYCMNEDRDCGYAVPAQCLDGNLIIPECFEEPSALKYNLDSGSLPSEIHQC